MRRRTCICRRCGEVPNFEQNHGKKFPVGTPEFLPVLKMQNVRDILRGLAGLRRPAGTDDPLADAFIKHNRRMWSDYAVGSSDRVILADFHKIAGTVTLWSYWLNILAQEYSAKIVAYSFEPPRTKLQSFRLRRSEPWRIWESFNAADWINCEAPADEKISRRIDGETGDLLQSVRTKEDILALTIGGYPLGLDLYESYLRARRWPTEPARDPVFAKWLRRYCLWTGFWEDYFERVPVAALVVSHDCFHHNILCRIANANGVPVWISNPEMAYKVPEPFRYADRCRYLRKWFSELPEKEQRAGMSWAKQRLDSRLSGEFSVESAYVVHSPFHDERRQGRVLDDTRNFKVLIATHCFFDNPHSYNGMLFADFYDWIAFLRDLASQTSYDWYLKVHRDPLPGTMEIIHHLLGPDSRIKLIPSETSHRQLVEEGIDAALTCYGTIGIEYAAMGLPVVNACRGNPHQAYNFNLHPQTKEEYREVLLGLPERVQNLRIDRKEVEECYFMKYHCLSTEWPGSLAHSRAVEALGPDGAVKNSFFGYFLEHWSEELHQEILHKEEEFLLSGADFNTRYGPRDRPTDLPA